MSHVWIIFVRGYTHTLSTSPPWKNFPQFVPSDPTVFKGPNWRSPPRHKSTLAMHLSLLHVSFIGTAVTPRRWELMWRWFNHKITLPRSYPVWKCFENDSWEMTPSISCCYYTKIHRLQPGELAQQKKGTWMKLTLGAWCACNAWWTSCLKNFCI